MHLRCDVLFLADVFQKFRNNSLKKCWLCLNHYLSATGSIYDAMVKMTKIKLVLIPDLYMFIFFQKIQEIKFVIFLVDIAKPTLNN